ncbi:MAG: hypothetical protein ACR2PL_21070, partial [Dehalococcoidia bacterium]
FEYDFSVTVVRLTDGSGNPVPGGGDNGRVILTAKGDVNGDGRMDAVDALCILRSVALLPGTVACPLIPPLP